jgi:tRNA/tmRNA/rRNA uracil-C5-methylase (TrmA/RlmC/RlmD family)
MALRTGGRLNGVPEIELVIERAGPGGDCVSHVPDGRVVFVRGALPGERVRVAVTDDNKKFMRADTVAVIEASPDRVEPPCPLAVPGRCGGCDWQHAKLSTARDIKGQVLREQLSRLGGIDPGPVRVQQAPHFQDGLGWRTRMQVSIGRDESRGLLRHRSHAVERVRSCPITHPLIDAAGAWTAKGPAGSRVRHQPRLRVSFAASPTTEKVVVDERGSLTHIALDHEFHVSGGGFWQVHPDAPEMLADAVVKALAPKAGERALDLYSGAGLFTYTLASHGLRVTAVESVRQAAADARVNCDGLEVDVVTADVADALAEITAPVDLVVLDPPRTGAGADVMKQIAALAPRAIAYVSCDGATLARDLRALGEAGYELKQLTAFDLFPMTAHLECLALLVPTGNGSE